MRRRRQTAIRPRFMLLAAALVVLVSGVAVVAVVALRPPGAVSQDGQANTALVSEVAALQTANGLFSNFHALTTPPDLEATANGREALALIAPDVIRALDVQALRALFAAAPADTYLQGAAAAARLLPASDGAITGAVGPTLGRQTADGYFEDSVGNAMTGADLDELRVGDTSRALKLLATQSARSSAVSSAIERAASWLQRRWVDLQYSPYLVWEVDSALRAVDRTLPGNELDAYVRAAIVSAAKPGTSGLRGLLDAFGATMLARDRRIEDGARLAALRALFEARLPTARDPLDAFVLVSGYLAAGGRPTDGALAGVRDELVRLQTASGLFGTPITGDPSLQATWYALGVLRLAGGPTFAPPASAALEATFASLSSSNAAELRAWYEASRLVGRPISTDETRRLAELAVAAMPPQLDEQNVFVWYQASSLLEELGVAVPARPVSVWPIADRDGALAAAVLVQTAAGRRVLDPEVVRTALRSHFADGLTMPELFYYTQAVGVDRLTGPEQQAIRARLDDLRVSGQPGYAGEPGGSEDLRATYFGLSLLDALKAGR